MNDDEQRIESADNVGRAILSCIKTLQSEQNKQFKGVWDDYFDDLKNIMQDYSSNIEGSLRDGIVEDYKPGYERLTGHERGTNLGRV